MHTRLLNHQHLCIYLPTKLHPGYLKVGLQKQLISYNKFTLHIWEFLGHQSNCFFFTFTVFGCLDKRHYTASIL